jgi:hypothetical protein
MLKTNSTKLVILGLMLTATVNARAASLDTPIVVGSGPFMTQADGIAYCQDSNNVQQPAHLPSIRELAILTKSPSAYSGNYWSSSGYWVGSEFWYAFVINGGKIYKEIAFRDDRSRSSREVDNAVLCVSGPADSN